MDNFYDGSSITTAEILYSEFTSKLSLSYMPAYLSFHKIQFDIQRIISNVYCLLLNHRTSLKLLGHKLGCFIHKAHILAILTWGR